MCSRGTIRITTIQISNKLGIPLRDSARQWQHPHPDTGEIRPNEFLPTIIQQGKEGSILTIGQWGIKNTRDGSLMRNARAETIDSLPTWTPMFQNDRVVIPFTGFYEWDTSRPKIGYQFTLDEEGEELMLLAGIADRAGRLVIITVDANQIVAPIHPRMPAILKGKTAMEMWLHPYYQSTDIRVLKQLLVPYQGTLYSRPLQRVA